MSEDEIRFLPYEEAAGIVAAIQEEEDIDRPNHQILTVYNQDNKEICWFDFEEVMGKVEVKKGEDPKESVGEYILNHLPDWVKDI